MESTVVEFFDEEPIANVTACLHYKFDRVIFVGFSEDCNSEEYKAVRHFLESPQMGVQEVEYRQIGRHSLSDTTERLRQVIQQETQQGRQCFFDLTGGQEQVLVALGTLMEQYDLPMHQVDVKCGTLDLLHRADVYASLEKRDYQLSVEEFLNLHCAVIDYSKSRQEKQLSLQDHWKDTIYAVYEIASEYGILWNRFCIAMRNINEQEDGAIRCDWSSLRQLQGKAKNDRQIMGRSEFKNVLGRLQELSLICQFQENNRGFSFYFASERIKNLLTTEGAYLESYVGYRLLDDLGVSDCKVGVSLDWELGGNQQAVIEQGDVMNEVDVIAMYHNIPIFVSCKNNQVTDTQPLYELDTIAHRFGGKFVVKVLAAPNGVTDARAERADEMDIYIKRDVSRWKGFIPAGV